MSENNNELENIPPYIPVIAGAFSGAVTRFICQPLDVIKIRFQLQVEPITKTSVNSKYKSIPQAVNLIIKEEGLSALWKGHVPAQLLSMTFGVVQFGSYSVLVNEATRYQKFAENISKVHFVCGFTAGSLATIVSSPFDIVRTRLILQGKNKVYRNTYHGLKHILQHEGFRGWFKGLSASLIQIGPLSGIQFATYHFYQKVFTEFEKRSKITNKFLTISATAAAGSLAGFTAKIMTYPLDLFRKRMQFQGFQNARKGFGENFSCSSLKTCFTETVRVERSLGLFKGLAPSLLKASIVNGLIFTLYEEMQNFLISISQTDI